MSRFEQPEDLPEAVDVMGLPMRPLTTDELVERVVARAAAGLRTRVCYANAHTVNLALRDRDYRAVLAASEILYADGASVVWASRFAKQHLPERMTAADYFPRFAERCALAGLSLFLLGGRPGVAEQAAAALLGRIGGLSIVGASHGYFMSEESATIVNRVNQAAPAVLVVGMSSPRQEMWIARHWAELRTPLCWCVGALFDYLAGRERRSPAWLCRMGGEWVHRLAMDPVNKWRRYVLGNPIFLWNLLRWRLSSRETRLNRTVATHNRCKEKNANAAAH